MYLFCAEHIKKIVFFCSWIEKRFKILYQSAPTKMTKEIKKNKLMNAQNILYTLSKTNDSEKFNLIFSIPSIVIIIIYKY